MRHTALIRNRCAGSGALAGGAGIPGHPAPGWRRGSPLHAGHQRWQEDQGHRAEGAACLENGALRRGSEAGGVGRTLTRLQQPGVKRVQPHAECDCRSTAADSSLATGLMGEGRQEARQITRGRPPPCSSFRTKSLPPYVSPLPSSRVHLADEKTEVQRSFLTYPRWPADTWWIQSLNPAERPLSCP